MFCDEPSTSHLSIIIRGEGGHVESSGVVMMYVMNHLFWKRVEVRCS